MNIKLLTATVAFAAAATITGSTFAAGDEANLDRLGKFQTTGTGQGQVIPQEGKFADNVRNIL